MKLRGRTDANQTAIVRDLRVAGCFVQSLANIGDGCPDLLVIRHGKVHLLEVKDGKQPPSKRKLTPAEIDWHNDAQRNGYTVGVVESTHDAFRAVGL